MMSEQGQPLRVLHVYGSLNRGGAETWLMDVVRNSTRDQWEIDVCVTNPRITRGQYEEEFEQLGGKILRCPLRRDPWSCARRFEQIVRDGRYDVVHSHLYYFSGLLLRAAARAGVSRRIAHNHPVEDLKSAQPLRRLYVWWMKRLMLRHGTGFVGPTKASMEGMWGPGWEADQRKRVVYNGIRVERFSQPADRVGVRRKLGIPDDASIVLNVARFAPHKRHEVLVEVAARILPQRPDVYFVLIGAGDRRQMIEDMVRAKGLEGRFRFLSGLASIDPYWLAADVFAFPSCNEGFGIVVIEAAAAGLRVIAHDIPGVREAAEPCPTITLLPLQAAVDDWAEAVSHALRREPIAAHERASLLRRFPFTIERSIAALQAVYDY